MYVKHPALTTPPPETVIWRYQDLGKLLSTIERQALFFSRLDRLGDPYEGALTSFAWFGQRMAAQSVAKENREVEEGIVSRMEEENRRRREEVFVNCWHTSEHESDAMWRLYCRSGECVAIKSTVGALVGALRATPQRVFVAQVNYINYTEAFFPSDSVLQTFVHKRLSFQHEHELRAIVTTDLIELDPELSHTAYVDRFKDDRDGGVYVPVDIGTLLAELFLAPYAPEWFERVVRATLAHFGVNVPIRRSSLSAVPPLF